MKLILNYDFYKNLCLSISEKIQATNFKFDEIIAISRGALTAAHIISKHLHLDVGYFMPNSETKLILAHNDSEKLLVIDDIIGNGKTYKVFSDYMTFCFPSYQYLFVPIVIADEFDTKWNFNFYGIKTKHWAVGPYDEQEKVVEGKVGYFRDGSDGYGQNVQKEG